MTSIDPGDDLTPSEHAAFDELSRTAASDATLEDRVVEALGARGLLRRRAPRVRRVIWALAAGFALFVAGYALGRRAAPPSSIDTSALPATHVTRVVWF